MNVEQNQINENRSIEEILLTSDEEDSSENFIDIETPDSNILNFSKNLNSSEISNSEQGNTSKNSILMLNDSSLKKTPPTPSLKFITHESDTDSFQTPDILHKSINSKKIDAEEIEFCYVNSESENEPYGEETFSNNTFQYIKNAKENICENSSELSYELCRKASTKLITVKKVDSFLVSKQNLKDFPTINKLNTKLPVSDSIQTLDLNENEISTNEKEIDDEMTSTPQFNSQSVNSLRSSLYFPSMNDPKLRMQCFVRLKKMDEDVFKFYRFDKYKQRAKKKKKISITYKSFNGVLSDDESGNSNSSTEWSISSNRKRKPKNKSALDINLNNNLNAAKSSSSTSIRNINSISSPSPSLSVSVNLNESDKKKSKRSLNENELEILQKKSKKNSHLFLNDNIAQILNEDTNLGFDTNQETFEVSHVQDGKLKIKKCSKMILQNNDEPSTALIDSEITKDSLNLNENSNSNSNITIVLSSSRSCSPIPELNEKIDERIKKPKKRVVDDLESDLSNQSNDSYDKKIEKPIVKIIKKSENLLKTTLKKATNNETVLINKQIGKISKSLESEQHRKEKENAPIKQNNDKVIRKNVEKDTNGSINKNQKPNETKMTNTNTENITERPKPFKIPKLNRQNDKIEDTIIKPQKNNLKDTKTNNHLVKKQNVKNETKSLKKDAKNIVNKKKEKSSDKVHKNNNNSNNNSNKKQNSNNEINKLMSSIPDNNNNNNNNHNNNHNNINDNNNKKLINKSMKILDKIKKRNIPTLNDLNQKRIAYNKSIGANYPYFSLLYLMDEYVKKMSTVACLDFNLLISYLPPNEDPELSVTNLDQNKQIQLCKLISRSAGKINIFKLFGLDCLLREYPRRYEPTAANFSKSLNDDEYFLSILNNLSLSQAVIVYKRFLSQLNTPFRIVDTARIANTNYETLIIKFENDFQVDSYDLSIESVVFSSLHKENKKFKVINNVLHQNYVCEQDLNQVSSNQSNNIKNDKLIIKPDSYDYIRKQVKDDQLLDKMFTKTCFEKVVRLKMPENFYMVCQSQINKKSKKEANINKKERFLNHVTSTRSDRGKMRIAEKHKVISDHEFNYRLKKLQNEHDIQVDLSNLFKDKN